MKVFTEILGNISSPEWRERVERGRVEFINLDQWTAQKSRMVIMRPDGDNYAVALERHAQIADGDILEYDSASGRIVALRVHLSDVMVVDLSELVAQAPSVVAQRAVELGHAIGNQHWPAVVKGTKVYVPMTVDRKVMSSVMQTHRLEGIDFSFQRGSEVIPYLAPHEIRRLFGGAEQGHEHHHHPSHVH